MNGLTGLRPFKDGYRPATEAEKRFDEADAILSDYSPLYRQTKPKIRVVTNSSLLSKIPAAMGRLLGMGGFRGSEGKPFNPSFAVPLGGLGGLININEENVNRIRPYENILAHEAGHIRQGLTGLPLSNDETADEILMDAFDTQRMRDSKKPNPIYWPPNYYLTLDNFGYKKR